MSVRPNSSPQGSNHEHGAHHHRSSKRNQLLAPFGLATGLYTGSLACFVAAGHNGVDGLVHELRHQAVIALDPTTRRLKRIQAAGVLAGAGVLALVAEKVVGSGTLRNSWAIPAYFAGETVVNLTGVVDDLRSGNGTADDKAGLGHNTIDAITSGATTLVMMIPSAQAEVLDAVAGYGHITLLTGLAALSLKSALTDKDDTLHA